MCNKNGAVFDALVLCSFRRCSSGMNKFAPIRLLFYKYNFVTFFSITAENDCKKVVIKVLVRFRYAEEPFWVHQYCFHVLYHVIEQKGMHLNHDFYVVVSKQCRTENAYTGHQYKIFIQFSFIIYLF